MLYLAILQMINDKNKWSETIVVDTFKYDAFSKQWLDNRCKHKYSKMILDENQNLIEVQDGEHFTHVVRVEGSVKLIFYVADLTLLYNGICLDQVKLSNVKFDK